MVDPRHDLHDLGDRRREGAGHLRGVIEPAQAHGVLLTVRLPLLLPAFTTAFGLSVALSVDELGATIMVYPPTWRTLPVTIFALSDRGSAPSRRRHRRPPHRNAADLALGRGASEDAPPPIASETADRLLIGQSSTCGSAHLNQQHQRHPTRTTKIGSSRPGTYWCGYRRRVTGRR